MRFDLRPGITSTGKGVAYITDSSSEGRNGLIIVDLGTGESWRHVSATEAVRPDAGFVGWVSGQPVYYYDASASEASYFPIGSDGIALSADGEDLFFCPLSSRRLYSVSTALLRDRGPASEVRAQQGTVYRGQKGFSDGFETDSNGFIYMGNFEQNAVVAFNPANGTVDTFVRDPRINWVDTCGLNPIWDFFAVQQNLLIIYSCDINGWVPIFYRESASIDGRHISRDRPSSEAICIVPDQIAERRE